MAYDPIDEFKRAITPMLSDWRAIEVRAIALLSPIGFLIDTLRVTFKHSSPARSKSKLTEMGDVLLAYEEVSIDETETIMTMIAKGELVVAGRAIQVKRQIRENEWVPCTSFYSYRWNREDTLARFGVDSASVVLQGQESYQENRSQQTRIDKDLLSGSPPYDGIEDLRSSFIECASIWQRQRNQSVLEVVAPFGVTFGKAPSAKGNRILFEIGMASNTDPRHVALVLLIKHKKKMDRRRVMLEEVARKSRPSKACIPIQPSKPFDVITCILTYRSNETDRFELMSMDGPGDNARWLTFVHFAGGTKALSEFPTSGKPFEAHLEVLFHLLGFGTAHYGGREWPSRIPSPDVIAFPPKGNWLLVIECTEREPDLNSKLSKLSTRTRELAKSMPGYHPYPVLVTALDRSVVSKTDQEKAANEGVAIIAGDELSILVKAVEEKKAPIEVRSILAQFAPRGFGPDYR
jgi:hypothetical protein